MTSWQKDLLSKNELVKERICLCIFFFSAVGNVTLEATVFARGIGQILSQPNAPGFSADADL